MIINTKKCLPLRDDFTFTAIDFERANNNLISICQVGICRVDDGHITKSYEYLVRPPQRVFYFQKKTTELHGITALDVENAPTFDLVWKEIFPDIEGRPLVAHSFRDDSMALDAVLDRYRIKYKYRRYGYLCTLELALRAGIHNEENKYNLKALCKRCGITLSPHHAGSDAEGCARLALKLAEELSINSLRELADFSQSAIFDEPDLPETLTCADLAVLENYLRRMRHRKNIQLSDCPRLKDLSHARKILKRNPEAVITGDTAMSAGGLAHWLEENRALIAQSDDLPIRRRRRRRRRSRTKVPEAGA